jgi:ABC-type Fe3+-hydroxamate transport system substrate-binding protein
MRETIIGQSDVFTQLNELIIRVADVKYIRCSAQWSLQPEMMSSYQIVFIRGGRGIFEIDGNSRIVGSGHLLFFSKGQKVQASSDFTDPLVLYTINFTYRSPLKKNEKYIYHEEGAKFPIEGEFYMHNQPQVLHLCEQLHTSSEEPETGRRQYQQTGLLHELLYLVSTDIQDGMEQPLTAVDRTVEYLSRNYMKTIQLETLSQLAGFSPSYYSRLFKKLKGISPTAYITKLRMDRAKELLVLSQGSFYEIARHLGYSEESYFSRVFKKETGYSPAHYVKINRQKIVIMKSTFNGDFLALGVTPCATVRVGKKGRPSFNGRLDNTLKITADGKACMDELIQVQPDIIVCDSQWAKFNKDAALVAPTVVIPYWDIAWRDRLYRIADLVGKRKQAKEWLRHYDHKAAQASQTIKSRIGDDTVIILRIVCGKLRIYGVERNIGSVLYQDLKLTPPEAVREIRWRKTITLEKLHEYNADYMLLMVSSYKADQKLLRNLRHSPEWNALTAVRNNHCFEIDLYPWIDYSALSHEMMIEETIGLFMK